MRPRPPSARRLRSALAPAHRPNPSPEPPWVLERRHAEGGEWFVVDRLWSVEGADDWVLGPPVAFDPGDLLRLLSPAGPTEGFWVQASDGLREAGAVEAWLRDRGPNRRMSDLLDWAGAWDGDQTSPVAMLDTAVRAGVDPWRLVGLLVEAAESVADRWAVRARRDARAALEAARRWSRGEGTAAEREALVEELDLAYWRAWEALGERDDDSTTSLVVAQRALEACGLEGLRDQDLARQTLGYVSELNGPRDERGYWGYDPALGPMVRRWVPLPILLLAQAGEPTPPEREPAAPPWPLPKGSPPSYDGRVPPREGGRRRRR